MARMTQTEIISSLADSCGCKKSDVKGMFDALASLATSEVRQNGEFTLPGFGKLKKTQRKARDGRNPATGGDQDTGKDHCQVQYRKSYERRYCVITLDFVTYMNTTGKSCGLPVFFVFPRFCEKNHNL